MAVLNPYFNGANAFQDLNPYVSVNGENSDNLSERFVYNNLVEERIRMYGTRFKYIVRTNNNIDYLFGESNGNFEYSFDIEMQPSVNGSEGQAQMLMLGYSMQDTWTIECSFRRLNEQLRELDLEDHKEPMVGDILYYPVANQIFEIKYITTKNAYHVLGQKTLYTFTCQIMDLGTETFNTGDERIDALNTYNDIDMNKVDNDLLGTEAKESIVNSTSSDYPVLWEDIINEDN